MSKALAVALGGLLLFGAAKRKPNKSSGQTSLKLTHQALQVDGRWLLPADEVARQAEGAVKLVNDGKLAIICLADHCTPVAVDGKRGRVEDGTLFVEQTALGRALQKTLTTDPQGRTVIVGPARASSSLGKEPFTMQIGQQVPDLEFSDLDGKPVHLSDFRGKRLAVFSWASW